MSRPLILALALGALNTVPVHSHEVVIVVGEQFVRVDVQPIRGIGQLSFARIDESSLLRFDARDYPSAALRFGEVGEVSARLQVNEAGQIAACEVTSPSGSVPLGRDTCRLASRRLRFTPALDIDGRPAPSEAILRICWFKHPEDARATRRNQIRFMTLGVMPPRPIPEVAPIPERAEDICPNFPMPD